MPDTEENREGKERQREREESDRYEELLECIAALDSEVATPSEELLVTGGVAAAFRDLASEGERG